MSTRKPFVAGNWKMNLERKTALGLALAVRDSVGRRDDVDVAVFPPYVYLDEVARSLAGSMVKTGAQNCSDEVSGAFTGEISPAMLVDVGATYVLIGHSERRHLYGEGDELVGRKVRLALEHGLSPILCVGETLAEREAGQTAEVVKRQLSAVIHQLAHCAAEMVVAYEPVWAIGTGRTATPAQAQEVHALLRAQLQAATGRGDAMRILYGGSVKADNAAELFAQPDIDGGLIGGASLKAPDFIAIVRAGG
jgi:triosephosphate isomerase